MFFDMVRFYGEEVLAPRRTSNLEATHPLSSVRDWLVNIFEAILGVLLSTTWGRSVQFTQGPTYVCGYETWSLTLREEHRLRLLENRVLREIFGPMRDEVAWKWERLYNGELYDLYIPPHTIQVIKSRRDGGWAYSTYGEGRVRCTYSFGAGNLREGDHL
jgi:hypothetical protein